MDAVFCYCGNWQQNIETLQSYFQFGQDYGFIEDLKTFKYCPWCGSKLMTIDELGEEAYGGYSE